MSFLVALAALVKDGGVVVNTVPTIDTPADEARGVRAVGVFVRSDAEQLSRLVAFLDQTPATRLTATAVVSRSDLDAMSEPTVDAKAVAALAGKRLELVRATVKKAGIEGSRLLKAKGFESGDGAAPTVKLDLAEPEGSGRAERTAEPLRSTAQVASPEPSTAR